MINVCKTIAHWQLQLRTNQIKTVETQLFICAYFFTIHSKHKFTMTLLEIVAKVRLLVKILQRDSGSGIDVVSRDSEDEVRKRTSRN